jgi:hypothetical protein
MRLLRGGDFMITISLKQFNIFKLMDAQTLVKISSAALASPDSVFSG